MNFLFYRYIFSNKKAKSNWQQLAFSFALIFIDLILTFN